MAIRITEDGTVIYENEPDVNRELFPNLPGGDASPEQIVQAVDEWLENHPEATTTVTDGSITREKLDSELNSYIEDITNLQTGKQDALTFDQTPTAESTNPVTSVGIKNAIEAAVDVTAPGIYETASGAITSFTDGADDLPMESAVVTIEPIQDLHGYDNPWLAGGGKNLVDIPDSTTEIMTETIIAGVTLTPGTYVLSADLKNTGEGTASIRIGNTYTISGATSSDGWKRVSTNPLVVEEEARFQIIVSGSVSGYAVSYKNVMIESGSEATSYAPYENICPISGRTGVSVVRTGKNLLQPTIHDIAPGSDLIIQNSDYRSLYTRIPCGGTYTVSRDTVSGNCFRIYGLYDDPVPGRVTMVNISVSQDDVLSKTFTVPDGIKVILIYLANDGSEITSKVQLELGSAVTAYEPYKGNTYSVNWETEAGTVYGGHVDVVSGKLTLTHRYWTDNGSKDWTMNIDGSFYTHLGTETPEQVISGCCCNYCPYAISFNGLIAFARANGLIFLGTGWGNVFTDVQSLKTAFAETPLQVVYKMSVPIEYQLSANEIRTLLGENNIWSDGGDMEVEYPADTKMYIDNKIAEAIAAAMA